MSMEAVGVYGRLSVQQPQRVWRGQPDVQPFRGPDADSCTLTVVCSGTVGSCRGDDGDDAVAQQVSR